MHLDVFARPQPLVRNLQLVDVLPYSEEEEDLAERFAQLKLLAQRFAQQKRKRHFNFQINFGLSPNLGLSKLLSERLVQKLKSPNVR